MLGSKSYQQIAEVWFETEEMKVSAEMGEIQEVVVGGNRFAAE